MAPDHKSTLVPTPIPATGTAARRHPLRATFHHRPAFASFPATEITSRPAPTIGRPTDG